MDFFQNYFYTSSSILIILPICQEKLSFVRYWNIYIYILPRIVFFSFHFFFRIQKDLDYLEHVYATRVQLFRSWIELIYTLKMFKKKLCTQTACETFYVKVMLIYSWNTFEESRNTEIRRLRFYYVIMLEIVVSIENGSVRKRLFLPLKLISEMSKSTNKYVKRVVHKL